MNPLDSHSPQTDQLLNSDPFNFSAPNQKLFFDSFVETALKHYSGNSVFRSFWDHAKIHPSSIRSLEDLARAPSLMVHLFKEWDLVSVARDQIQLRLTSSGTGGQKSQMLLNEASLKRVKHLAYKIHERLGMTTSDLVNYLCFTYDPKVANDLGTAFTDELLTSFTGRKSVYYTFQWNDHTQDFEMNEAEIIQTLRNYEKEGLPVRILGFPAFLVRLLKNFPNENFKFGFSSWVQTGGGWKGLANEQIPKHEFRELLATRLGIPLHNVRDLFGMVEHGIPYVDCALGQLHVPNYARIFIRDPINLELLPEGHTGLVEFICTYNDSYPSPVLLSTDYGRLGKCKCPIGGQTLEILGRAGITQHKGCAIHSLETVRTR